MTEIHPLAYVDPKATLGRNVRVAPFAYVGPDVEVGDDSEIHPHATLLGPARFGQENIFFPHSTLGAAPQDLKFRGGITRLETGDQNVFRENVTVHRGTEVDRQSGGVTRIGDHNLFMVGVHVAHDSDIGSHVVLANHVQIAGHVCIEDCVNIGGASAMHHFVTVGRYANITGMTRITHDVPPYLRVDGRDQEVRAVNTKGLQRWHIDPESIRRLKEAFRLLYARRNGRASPGRTMEQLHLIEQNGLAQDPHVAYLVRFLRDKMQVGVYGRVRESARLDTDHDRARFYGRAPETET